ncbi:MAG: acetylxylan esterase [Cetobacterium sp.]
MPNIDLPLSELKKYKGRDICPADIDEFWKKSVEKLSKSDADVRITPAEFKSPVADCYDLVFKSFDGEDIYVKMMLPKNIKKQVPAIVQFHGYGGYSDEWSKKIGYVASGNAFFSMDCRDQMGKSGESHFKTGNLVRGVLDGAESYFWKVYLDVKRVLDIVFNNENIDKERVATLGYSQGGALALVGGALDNRVSKVFSVYPYLSDFKRVWEMDFGGFAYNELRDLFRYYDPQHLKEDEIFKNLAYIDIKNLTKNITGDVVMVTGLMDNICAPSTQFAAYNNIDAKKEHLIYPEYGHENIPGLEDIIYNWLLTLNK